MTEGDSEGDAPSRFTVSTATLSGMAGMNNKTFFLFTFPFIFTQLYDAITGCPVPLHIKKVERIESDVERTGWGATVPASTTYTSAGTTASDFGSMSLEKKTDRLFEMIQSLLPLVEQVSNSNEVSSIEVSQSTLRSLQAWNKPSPKECNAVIE